jgi:hypothetical protein
MAAVHLLAADRRAERVPGETLVYLEKGCTLKSEAACQSAAEVRRVRGDAVYDETVRRAREAPKAASAAGGTVTQPLPTRDQTASVQLTLPGWVEEAPEGSGRTWRDAVGDVLSLSVVRIFPLPRTEPELQRAARQLAEGRGGGLIEASVVAAAPRPIVDLVYKRLQAPAYVFTGMLMMARQDSALVFTIVSGERGTTGVREATITAELMKSGELTVERYQRSWAQDPYDPTYHGVDRSVLRFLSDDRRYDAQFPGHPLSKVRRVLAELPAAVGGR